MHFVPPHITAMDYAVATIVGAVVIIVWRIRETQTPVTLRKIVIPPLGMATGFCMFLVPPFRIPWLWALVAFLTGAILLAWPLTATTKLHRAGEAIMMKRSQAFLIVIVVLAAVRFFARGYFDKLLTVEQTGALFFILAFGMIVRWRAGMLFAYRALAAHQSLPAAQ